MSMPPRKVRKPKQTHSYNLRSRAADRFLMNSPLKSGKTSTKRKAKRKTECTETSRILATLCTICQDTQEYRRIKKAICGHSFHSACLKNWLKESASCPICRGNIRNIPQESTANQSGHSANPQQSVNQSLPRELARASVSISFVWVT